MDKFTSLIFHLENTSRTSQKEALLKLYFEEASDEDKLWAIALFADKRPKRQVTIKQLKLWAIESSGLNTWLFDESYGAVGDLAETIALILPPPIDVQLYTLSYWINYLEALNKNDEEYKKAQVLSAWSSLGEKQRFVFNKIITGGFRVGVSKNTISKVLASILGLEATQVTHLLMGDWTPNSISFDELLSTNYNQTIVSKPFPFYLAYPLDGGVKDLGDPSEWSAEWKWDGIRCQLIKREGQLFIWSRGEELITNQCPEFDQLQNKLPDGTVIDGELLAFRDHPLPFSTLQTRIGRKSISKKQLLEAPLVIYAYDLLEFQEKDIRKEPFWERRVLLENFINTLNSELLQLSESLAFSDWSELIKIREKSRNEYAEGLMLKRLTSTYKVGRKKGDWWKWKVDPYTIDAVMVYAQMGHGRRADLFSDFTFALWNDGELITFTKAYSGLSNKELEKVSKFVKANTVERFGPVRTVNPTQVFELHFDGVNPSKRHKSGFSVRFPRILRWRRDKDAAMANSINDLKAFCKY